MYRGVLSRLILANIFATPEGRIYPAQALFDVLSIRPDVNNFWQYPTNSKQATRSLFTNINRYVRLNMVLKKRGEVPNRLLFRSENEEARWLPESSQRQKFTIFVCRRTFISSGLRPDCQVA
jgi:hypothetical protein